MFRCLILVGALLSLPVLAGPDDDFVEVYQLIQQTDAQREAGYLNQARAGYEQAQERLRTLKKNYPQWNERVVAYRLRYVAEKLEALPIGPLPEAAVVVGDPASRPVNEPANEVLVQFNALNSEISSLRVEKERLEAKLREALTAQPAPVDPKELQAAVERIAQLQSTNKLLVSRLEAQQIERASLVERVLLDEAQEALAAANRKWSDQREKSVELERLRTLAEGELKRLREVELKELKTANTTLQTQVEALQTDTERGLQIANLTERLTVLQSKFEEAQRVNDVLAADRDKLEQELQGLRVRQEEEGLVRVKHLETDLALARAEADRQTAMVTQLEARLVSEASFQARLEEENKNLATRIEALTLQVSEVKSLQTQLEAEQEEKQELEAQLRTAEEQLGVLAATGSTPPGDPSSGLLPGSTPDPALVAHIQILTAETVRLREALRDGRTRQTELMGLLADAQAATARLESEKRALTKTLAETQATPSQRQLARAHRTIKSLEERVEELEKERDKLAQKLAEASERSRSGIQLARRARLGNPREDARRFREDRR